MYIINLKRNIKCIFEWGGRVQFESMRKYGKEFISIFISKPVYNIIVVKVVQCLLQVVAGDIASWAESSIWEGSGDVSKTKITRKEICSRDGAIEGILMLMPARLDWYAAGEMCRLAPSLKKEIQSVQIVVY